MGIPSELISQLVKINNNTAKKKTESTVYGETVERDGSIYVRFDGSELLTPVSNTANVGPGERVIVLIKNHTATITGNLTSPAARVVTDPVTQKKTVENIDLDGVDSIRVELIEVKELLGEKVSLGEIEGEFAAIDELQADNVSVKARLTAVEVDVSNLQADNANIKEKLTAAEGDISTLKADNVTIKDKLSANEVSVKTLEADNVSVKGKIEAAEADITTLKADNVTVKGKIEAAEADITTLKADNVTVNGKIEAAEADISTLKTDNVTVKGKIEAAEADISTLKADNVTVKGKIEATEADIKTLKTNKLDATAADIKYATIGSLDAEKARIDDLSVNKLDANSATITDLQAGLADIDTLIFGSASGTSIQTSFANSVIAQLGNAQIKSAMIESVSASKITAGDIITNNIKVKSNDGKLLISDETIQISDDTRVRVQIGKDAANDYSINIWDDEGNLMFSKGGITDSAIKEAIIRNDMVKDDANISAKKLDIDSLFDEVNGSSKTIKSSKIMVDEKNQTLDVAFTSMTSDLNGAKDDISSQGTQISAIQGQITSKVWQQDIETAVDGIEVGGRNLLRKYMRAGGYTTYVDDLSIMIQSGKVDRYFYLKTTSDITAGETYTLSFDVSGFAEGATHNWYCLQLYESWSWIPITKNGRVSGTIVAKSDIPANTELLIDDEPASDIPTAYTLSNFKLEKGNKATDWTPAPEDVDGAVTTLNTKYSELKQSTDGVALTVAGHTTELTNKAGKGEVTDVSNRVTNVEANLEGFKSTVSSTYTTKEDFNNLEIGGRNLLPTSVFKDPNSVFQNTTVWVFQNNGIFVSAAYHYSYFGITLCENLVVGETYTISCRVASSPTANYSAFRFGNVKHVDNNGQYYFESSPRDEHKIVCTFEATSNILTMTLYPYAHDTSAPPADAWMYAYDIKLEKGNKATDWTPAPEDVEDDISDLSGRMENAETKIEQKADSISLSAYASKTDLENGMNAVKQWKSEQAIDLRDTTVYSESKWYPVVGARMPGAYYLYIQVYANLHGECKPSWCTHDDGFVVDFGVKTKASGWGATDADTVILEDTYKFIAYGEASPVSYDQCYASSEPILWLRGGGYYRVRTDYACLWTPYPSGYTWQSGQYAYAFNVSSFRPTPLGNHLASDEETKASLEVLTNGIKANVTETNDLKTRMSTVEQTAEGLTVSLEELEIGGRNLYTGTKDFSGDDWDERNHWTVDGVDSIGNVRLKKSSSWHGVCQYMSVKAGETYTLSMNVLGDGAATHIFFASECDEVGNEISQKWFDLGVAPTVEKRVSATYTVVNDSHLWFRLENSVSGATLWISSLKLEKGNKPTDWTPAPEDVQNGIDNASKTATNFLSYDATNGLQVGNKSSGSWSGYRTQIKSDAFNILDADGMVCASYGKNLIELGKGNTDSVISLCGGLGEIKVTKSTDYTSTEIGILDLQGDHIRLVGSSLTSIHTSYDEYLVPDDPSYGTKRISFSIEASKYNGIHLGGYKYVDSDYNSDDSSASIDITVNSVIGLADDISMTGRYSALYDTVQGDITIRPGLGGNLLLEPANDLILDPGRYTKVRSKLFISSAEKAAYNDGVTGWYFGDDGTAHVTHVDGASISFHYGNSSETSSIIRETDYGVISINGMKFGVNRVLWSGAYYMQGSHDIELDEYVTDQANGIVLIFSSYSGGAAQNSGWNAFFVPKHMTGCDIVFTMSTSKFGTMATKTLLVDRDFIYGSDDNVASGTSSSGITYNNKAFVLRYVIGV